jgi:hypothetical protein
VIQVALNRPRYLVPERRLPDHRQSPNSIPAVLNEYEQDAKHVVRTTFFWKVEALRGDIRDADESQLLDVVDKLGTLFREHWRVPRHCSRLLHTCSAIDCVSSL